MRKKLTLSFGLFLGLILWAEAQPQRVPGQALFQVRATHALSALKERWQNEPWGKRASCFPVAVGMNIWLLAADPSTCREEEMIRWLNAQPEVSMAQYNHLLEHRGNLRPELPNDPLYSNQWHHRNPDPGGIYGRADLASEQAWDITTGGISPYGDTLVIAIVDSGIDAQHEDLTSNLWYNWSEIPNNKIDDDQNGYVDDFQGWNTRAQNDQINGFSTIHGTPIAALAGARGNNGKGITGVNWQIKLLFVVGNDTEATILASFDYVLRARRRYNATNGQQGAFVVAVNCSWGINGGKPSDAPLWCAAFDSLGAVGILSVGATANAPVNVDIFGDLPTTCPSDFLITVTSLTAQNQKASNAAWGATSIDLGAYGESVFTARPGNQYGFASGTSFAAPLVTGAVALLYAAPCNNLIAMAKANPAAAALWAKNLLLRSTVPLPALQGITLTGGRLHLHSLLKTYEDRCSNCIPPFGIVASPLSKDTLQLSWSLVSDTLVADVRWREKGTAVWNVASAVKSPFLISGLKSCTNYEISLRTRCRVDEFSPWVDSLSATTAGCCTSPYAIKLDTLTTTRAVLSWSGPETAIGYMVELFQPQGPTLTFVVSEPRLSLSHLIGCTSYSLALTAMCAPTTSSLSTSFSFSTPGCGACLDQSYCSASATYADHEWIASVQIGSWMHHPTPGKGYQNYTANLDNLPVLLRGVPTTVSLRPGYAGQPHRQHFRMYIDYNGDGDFFDAAELAFDPSFAVTDAVEGLIVVPPTVLKGLARMRILMKYRGVAGSPPTPCEQFEFGQVADYCVRIDEVISTHQVADTLPFRIYPNPAHHWLSLEWRGDELENLCLRFYTPTGQLTREERLTLAPTETAYLDLSGLLTGFCFVEIASRKHLFWVKILIQRS
ncbi:MAG: S8 family serine peptidase [Saprospiraceae bacterium]|nr:S8 family serine peptidase [Saprospiraceae bacterium]MDW8484943.1 S8 family serine peptidase [Saprospiraceae bacterium]